MSERRRYDEEKRSASSKGLAQEDPSDPYAPIELQELSSPTERDTEQGLDTNQEENRSHDSLDSDRTLLRSPDSIETAQTLVSEARVPSQTSPAEQITGSVGSERTILGGENIPSPRQGGCVQCICNNKHWIAGFACVCVLLGGAMANDLIKNGVFDGDTSDGVSASPVPSVPVHPVNNITTALDSLSLSQGAEITTNEPVNPGPSTLLRRQKPSQTTPAKATLEAEDSVQ